jgi:hypothetical protein
MATLGQADSPSRGTPNFATNRNDPTMMLARFRRSLPTTLAASAIACASFGSGCAHPVVANDGTVVFQEQGAHGASVVTANGIEFHDTNDAPKRIVVREPGEPWRAPIGFILPKNGRFTATSSPTIATTSGLAIVLRPSDTRVPSWGGEVLVRIDVIAPAAAGAARYGEDVAIIVDGDGEDTSRLVDETLAQLSSRDRVTVIDAQDDKTGIHVVVPMMPASHRSLAVAAVEKRIATPQVRGRSHLADALLRADSLIGKDVLGRVVVFSNVATADVDGAAVQKALALLATKHVIVNAIGSSAKSNIATLSALTALGGGSSSADPDIEARLNTLREAVPVSGPVAFHDVTLSFEGTPAPSHVLEASGGDVRWRLDSGELFIGDVHKGEARTEVVRVSVPAWVPGERFAFTVTVHAYDVALKMRRDFAVQLPCVYDDDIERIANSRNGDVIAYASALATLQRLNDAFAGVGVETKGGLRAIAEIHAQSMALLARDTKDHAIYEQAEVLRALLAAE